MKPNRFGIAAGTVLASLLATTLHAQDPNKVVVVEGVFQRIDWAPSVYVHLEAKNSKGQTERWVIQGGSPSRVMREAIRDSLRPGQTITVCGLPSRLSPSIRESTGVRLDGGAISFLDGQTFYFGPAADSCRQVENDRRGLSKAASVKPVVNSPVQPFVNSPVQPFVSAPVTAFGVAPVSPGAFGATSTTDKPILLQGVITGMDWTSPEAAIYLDVRGAAGLPVHWIVSGDSPQVMLQRGLSKEALRVGEAVVVCGVLPSTESGRSGGVQTLNAGGVAFPDGRTQYFGSAADACRGSAGSQESVARKASPNPVVNSPVQPFVTPPVTRFGVDPASRP